ncbi:MAG: hypothetical protein AB7U82_27925 [Blastocatellales bacterium]
MLQDGLLNVGFVLIGIKTVTLQCLKCAGDFVYYSNGGATANPSAPLSEPSASQSAEPVPAS